MARAAQRTGPRAVFAPAAYHTHCMAACAPVGRPLIRHGRARPTVVPVAGQPKACRHHDSGRCRCRRRYRRRCCRHRKEKSPPGMSPLGLQPPHPPTTGARIRPTTATDVSKQRRPLVPAPRACPPAKPFQARTHNAHRLISTCADHHTENHQSSLAAGSTPDSRRTVPQPARREPAQ